MNDIAPDEAKQLLDQLGESSPDCSYLVTPDWEEMLYVSAAYEDIWGQPRETVYEDSTAFLDEVHPEDRERVREAMSEMSDGNQVELEYRVNSDEDYSRWVWAHGEPIYEEGEIVRLGGFVRDITEQTRQRRERERKREKLEVLNQVVRHDLRNEMQIVRGRAELLKSHVDDAGQTHLDDIFVSVTEAIDLTTTARDLTETMLNDGAEKRPISVNDVVRSAVETIRARHEATAITVFGLNQDVRVMADDMLESVLHNLLQNSILHNDSDLPEVEITVEEREDTVLLSVADNGPSIPDERKEVIFGRGEKGLKSSGTGLGLYLARTLVEQYEGEIWVEDGAPAGSVFRLELPRADPA